VPGGGESRVETIRRYVEGYRIVLGRPERTILVVAHGLPIRYVLDAAAGTGPVPRIKRVPYAEPFPVSATQLTAAIAHLEAWLRAPAWAS
jgi:broad specificity phosphatase PhoE